MCPIMNRVITAATVALFAVPAWAAEGEAPPASIPKLQVMTFAALAGEVPQRAGVKAAGMLAQEFKSADSMQLVDAKKGVADKNEPNAEALAAARKGVKEAQDLRSKRKFRLAAEGLDKALAEYKANASSVSDVGEVVDAYALLSAVQYNTGRDEEGLKSLNAALAMAPDRELPLAATSALFSHLVADQRKLIKSSPKGILVFESTPSGGAVTVDGIGLGNTPLSVTEVPPGLHYFKVLLANGETVGGTAEVMAGKQAKVTATSASKDPESRILGSLAQNKIDQDLLNAAKEQAALAQADFLVFGALSKEGRGLALDSFLFAAAGNEIRRLPRSNFDTELLSAGVEFYNLAGALAKTGAKTGDPVKVPSPVSASGAGPVKVADAKYGIPPGKDISLDAVDTGADTSGGAGAEKRTPLGGKRAPLKKK
jgi:hypothetical protein